MRRHRKHDTTDEVIAAVDGLEPFESRLRAILRAYKQGDLLRDVCMAREEAFRLRSEVDAIVRMVVELAMDLMKKRPLLKFCDTEQVMRSDAGGAS